MFSRKKRSTSTPPAYVRQGPAPSSAASVAASAAFLNRQPNNGGGLSSAAAAAALRSITVSPTSVSDVRTKRMVRRDSNSSFSSAQGTGNGSQRQPFSSGVQRRGSSSSMTDRTFRSPSPGRGLNDGSVPPIPDQPVPPIQVRRQSSQQSLPSTRTGTQENSGKKRQPRPLSVTSNTSAAPAPAAAAVPSPTSPRSINFSRPMSPPLQVKRPASTLGFTRDGESAAAPPQKAGHAVTTSPRGNGPYHVGGQVNQSAAATAAARSTNAAQRPGSSGGASPDQIKAYQARAAALLARPRSEAYLPPAPAPSSNVNRSNSLLLQKPAPLTTEAVRTPAAPAKPTSHNRGASQPVAQLAAPAPAPAPATPARSLSVSPARSAHFSDRPVTGSVKHQPPGRAVSPYKSALKSPSPRPQSPALAAPSDAGSDAGSQVSEIGSTSGMKKKKSVRVSFDEKTSIGEAAIPVSPINSVQSPQHQKAGDSDEEYSGMGGTLVLPSFGSVRKAKTDSEDLATAASVAPVIEVQPATPLLDEDSRKELVADTETQPGRSNNEDMPSAEGAEHVSQSQPLDAPVSSSVDLSTPSRTDVGRLDQEQPALEQTDATSEGRQSFESNTDTDEDEFSDAAEDPSELESRGFLSLDAILESPGAEEPEVASLPPKEVAPQETLAVAEAIPETALTTDENLSQKDQDWDTVKAYWTGLSEQSKQQMEAAATPLPDKQVKENSSGRRKDKPSSPEQPGVPLPPWPDQHYQKQAINSSAASASTVPAGQKAGKARSPMRSTMRGEEPPREASSSRQASSAPAPRPLSTVTPSAATVEAIARAKAARRGEKPALVRQDSAGSDSSFKKARKAKKEERHSMRMSMRQDAKPSQKVDARPLSPDSNPRTTMRHSMRRNSVTSIDSRASKESTSRFSLFGRSSSKTRDSPRSSKKEKKIKKQKGAGTGSSSRRFDDSSDSDGEYRPSFKSKIVDSDDSDDDHAFPVANLTPVRAIPRRNGQQSGESTDLEDSDNEAPAATVAPTAAAAPTAVNSQNVNGHTAEGTVLGAGTLRDSKWANDDKLAGGKEPEKKRKSLFSFSRKKKDTPSEAGSAPASPVVAKPIEARPATPTNSLIATELSTPQPVNSPASPAAQVATPTSPLPAAHSRKRSSSRASSIFRRFSTSAPVSPAHHVANKDSEFPFAAAPPIPAIPAEFQATPSSPAAEKTRPMTSDGVNTASKRPPLGSKRDSNLTAPESGADESQVIYSMRTGKKKKFQVLRKRLGIND